MIHLEPWELFLIVLAGVFSGGYIVWQAWTGALSDIKAQREQNHG